MTATVMNLTRDSGIAPPGEWIRYREGNNMPEDPFKHRAWSDAEIAEVIVAAKADRPLWDGLQQRMRAGEDLGFDLLRLIHRLHPQANLAEQAILQMSVIVRIRKELGLD